MSNFSGKRLVSSWKPAITPASPPTLSSAIQVMMIPPATSSDTCTMSVSATAFRPPYSAYSSANSASAVIEIWMSEAR